MPGLAIAPGSVTDGGLSRASEGLLPLVYRLAADHPRPARLVHLRFFLGMSLEEAAAALGIQARTAYRDWAYARAWLRRELDRVG